MVEKKFRVLRFVGTVWKILAWIILIVGLLTAIAVLVLSLVGEGQQMMGRWDVRPESMPWGPGAFGVVGGVVGFLVSLLGTVVYFLLFYAAGELVFLLIAIEENTRVAAQSSAASSSASVPTYAPPPPAFPEEE
jgi:hypothetical protein